MTTDVAERRVRRTTFTCTACGGPGYIANDDPAVTRDGNTFRTFHGSPKTWMNMFMPTGKSLTNASRCRVSGVSKLADASFSYSGVGGWAETGRLDGFLSLGQAVWRTRGFGDFWSHMLVAEGAVDVSAEPDVSLWDLAALQVIVEEAGGRFTSLDGIATPDGGSVVCSNGHLHDEVLAHLAAR